jgi:hypothetical protein
LIHLLTIKIKHMAGGGTAQAKALKTKGMKPGPNASAKTKAAFTRMSKSNQGKKKPAIKSAKKKR